MKPPGKIDFDEGNLALIWKRWREEFTLYMDLTMENKEETFKVKLLYYLIGEKGREICETLGVGSARENLFVEEVLAASPFLTLRKMKQLRDILSSHVR